MINVVCHENSQFIPAPFVIIRCILIIKFELQIWMCGGTLETTPCSHVGHIFRKRSPYKWRKDVDVLRKNNIRLCEVWLDEYKQYYYDKIGIQSVRYILFC